MALYHIQELEKDIRVYGSPRFRRVIIVTISTQGRLFCNCGYIHRAEKPCHHCYHVTCVIECTDCETIWWDSFHYHFRNTETRLQEEDNVIFEIDAPLFADEEELLVSETEETVFVVVPKT
jgi:hypothetical protein